VQVEEARAAAALVLFILKKETRTQKGGVSYFLSFLPSLLFQNVGGHRSLQCGSSLLKALSWEASKVDEVFIKSGTDFPLTAASRERVTE